MVKAEVFEKVYGESVKNSGPGVVGAEIDDISILLLYLEIN